MNENEVKPAEQSATNPFDTSREEEELNSLKAELEQARASIEKDFATHMSNLSDEAMEELFLSDKVAFYEAVLKEQNAFLEKNINSKIAKANELEKSIGQKKNFAAIDEARKAFETAHPDAKVSVDELLAFYEKEIPPNIAEQLSKLDPLSFFEELYALYQSVKNPNEQENQQLPKALNGVSSDTSNISSGMSNSYFDRL